MSEKEMTAEHITSDAIEQADDATLRRLYRTLGALPKDEQAAQTATLSEQAKVRLVTVQKQLLLEHFTTRVEDFCDDLTRLGLTYPMHVTVDGGPHSLTARCELVVQPDGTPRPRVASMYLLPLDD